MQNNFNNGGLFLNKEKQPFFDERLAFFSALCLFLSAFEFTIPKPLPFFRLGLANLPLILALEKFKLKDYIALSFMKVFLQGFLAGTFFSYIFLFSFAGTFFSSLVIYIAFLVFRRKGFISFFTLSILGAFASNCAQLLCAKFILFGSSVKYIKAGNETAYTSRGLNTNKVQNYISNEYSGASQTARRFIFDAL